MKTLLFAACALLCMPLTACESPNAGGTPPVTPPAPVPLPVTTDTAIRQAFSMLEKAANTIDLAVRVGAVKPGSPTALRIASGLDQARDLLNQASEAERLGNAVIASERYIRALNVYDAIAPLIERIPTGPTREPGGVR